MSIIKTVYIDEERSRVPHMDMIIELQDDLAAQLRVGAIDVRRYNAARRYVEEHREEVAAMLDSPSSVEEVADAVLNLAACDC